MLEKFDRFPEKDANRYKSAPGCIQFFNQDTHQRVENKSETELLREDGMLEADIHTSSPLGIALGIPHFV